MGMAMENDYEPVPLPPLDESRRRRAGETLMDFMQRLWPEARQAIADVDRTLFTTTLPLSPIDRLEQATRAAWELEELRQSLRRDN